MTAPDLALPDVVLPEVETLAAAFTPAGRATESMHRRLALDALAAAARRVKELRERPTVVVQHSGASDAQLAKYAARGWQVAPTARAGA